ncbi:riboflavin synthase [Victivallis sp. Marseille-Q1083]|uniref:riboflavin synthase n=1 Tax=Victivallis sp. Marseille-Q1083 TaxID=2717288 RepID=UPI00158A78CE|nr:riboflavin synthase [Victivallis sp. Marseille-Q1083]
MFTGLIESIGYLRRREKNGGAGKLVVETAKPFVGLRHGESIAVNGACLTLEKELSANLLQFHTLEETLLRTNLGSLPLGGCVNLERALRLGDRLGGHLVTGHVDGTGKLISLRRTGGDYELKIAAPPDLQPFLAPKGSIAVDGVSLTLVEIAPEYFTVHLIPVTLEETALGGRRSGEPVNLESDLLGKYVWRQLPLLHSAAAGSVNGGVSLELLREFGFME